MSIEHSRKRGPFDGRSPSKRHKPVPASLWRRGDEPADWERFLARFFPGCRRHDFDALAAYESYRNDVDGRRADDLPAPDDQPAATHVAASDDVRRRDEEDPGPAAETDRWEGEGGALTARVVPSVLSAAPDSGKRSREWF